MKYKTSYASPRLNGQYPYCAFPFSLDTYSGCSHLCKYCFSYYNYLVNSATQGGKRDFFSDITIINFNQLNDAFAEEKEKESKTIKTYRPLIENRMPIHWGGISDPFSDYERVSDEKVSLKCLKLFNQHQYPVIISTKSKWLKEAPEYLKEISENKNLIFQVSLISFNEKMQLLEPGTTVSDRLALLKEVSKTNYTVVRVQPYIPNLDTPEAEEEMIKTLSEHGAKAITMEFLKLSSFQNQNGKKMIDEMSSILGYDLIKYYKFKGQKTSTDYEIKSRYKLPVIRRYKELAHKYGMKFYCADNIFRDEGDGSICCGVPDGHPGFESYFSTQISEGVFKAKRTGELHFKDLFDKQRPHEKSFLGAYVSDWLNSGEAENRVLLKGKTFMDKLAFIWDNPKNPNNPSNFFENLTVGGIDEEGHLWFKYVDSCGSCSGCQGCK